MVVAAENVSSRVPIILQHFAVAVHGFSERVVGEPLGDVGVGDLGCVVGWGRR